MSKLTVEYDPDNGLSFPDNKSKKYVKKVIKDFIIPLNKLSINIVIGTDLLIDLFRCEVMEGKIKHTEIEFLFKEEIIKINRDGTCNNWPKGFGDTSIETLERLLECNSEK